VVTYPNEECTTKTNNDIKGICMNSDECTNAGGTSDGKCASGFGMCCRVILKTNGGVVNHNITYVQNPNFPNGETTAEAMTRLYTINPVNSSPAVCQIRLDFDTFVLTQPNQDLVPVLPAVFQNRGACDQDTIAFTSPTGGGVVLPTLCGTLTDQHMYLETGGQTPAATFTITTNAVANNNRMWNIKVTQIPCHTTWKAPADCLQYHTGRSGTFRGFNHPAGNIIQGQLYSICIRQEEGSCSISYSTRQAMQGVTPFQLTPVNGINNRLKAKRSRNNCGRANLSINGDVANGPGDAAGGIFCGGSFNHDNDNVVDGAVSSYRAPFGVTVFVATNRLIPDPDHVDQGEDNTSPTGDAGFSLQYTQLGCGNRFSLA